MWILNISILNVKIRPKLIFIGVFVLLNISTYKPAQASDCYEVYLKLISQPKPRAMVSSDSKRKCYWWSGASSQRDAKRQALALCMKEGAKDCVVLDAEEDIKIITQAQIALISKAQERLKYLGFYSGIIDGVNSKGTKDAVLKFQNDRGLEVTGIIDESLLTELSTDLSVYDNKELCFIATRPGKNNGRVYETNRKYLAQVQELKLRGLSEQDCAQLVILNDSTKSDRSISTLTDTEVCRAATYKAGPHSFRIWEAGTVWIGHVEEAKRRILNPENCELILNPVKSKNTENELNITSINGVKYTKRQLCIITTKFEDGIRVWDIQNEAASYSKGVMKFYEKIQELNIKLEECVSVLDDISSTSAALSDADEVSFARVSDLEICKYATRKKGAVRGWEDGTGWKDHVKEATQRGLNLSACEQLIVGTVVSELEQGTKTNKSLNSKTTLVQQEPEIRAGKRVALIVGNGAYRNTGSLRNPPNDASAISALLSRLGFEVISGIDLTKAVFEEKVRQFAVKTKTSDTALFFYAGHGIQVNGKNYLVPIDAKVEDELAIDFELIDADTITQLLGGEGKAGIVLLDACRNNPFKESLKRSLMASKRSTSVESGLAEISSVRGGLVIGFATAPDQEAEDGENMPNSPFTTALLQHLATPGLEIELIMKRVKGEVIELTQGEQRPWTNSDLATEVYLTEGPAN